MAEVIRTYKFRMKVKTDRQWQLLLRLSRCATAVCNYASLVVNGDAAHRQVSIDRQLAEWKKAHPIEAAAYDAEMEKWNEFCRLRTLAKRGKAPWPVHMKHPKKPVRITSEVKKRVLGYTIEKMWSEHRKMENATIPLRDGEMRVDRLHANEDQMLVRGVAASVCGAIKMRMKGKSASFPQQKPNYANTSFPVYRPYFDIEESHGMWTLVLNIKGEKEPLRLRFYPNRKEFRPDIVKSIRVGREKRTRKWWTAFCVRLPMDTTPLPSRTVGIDINSGKGNSVVVADQDGELFRRSMPDTLEKIQKRIENLQRMKNETLNLNGDDYGTRKVRSLKKRICRLHMRAANIRRNALHHFSKEVVHSGSIVGLEDLDVQDMTKSAKGTVEHPGVAVSERAYLNRKMLAVAPATFRSMVTYKSHGLEHSKVVVVNPAGTSQECCYCQKKGLRDGRNFVCRNRKCHAFGVQRDADENAAMNISIRAHTGRCEEIKKPSGKTKTDLKQEKKADKRAAGIDVAA